MQFIFYVILFFFLAIKYEIEICYIFRMPIVRLIDQFIQMKYICSCQFINCLQMKFDHGFWILIKNVFGTATTPTTKNQWNFLIENSEYEMLNFIHFSLFASVSTSDYFKYSYFQCTQILNPLKEYNKSFIYSWRFEIIRKVSSSNSWTLFHKKQ